MQEEESERRIVALIDVRAVLCLLRTCLLCSCCCWLGRVSWLFPGGFGDLRGVARSPCVSWLWFARYAHNVLSGSVWSSLASVSLCSGNVAMSVFSDGFHVSHPAWYARSVRSCWNLYCGILTAWVCAWVLQLLYCLWLGAVPSRFCKISSFGNEVPSSVELGFEVSERYCIAYLLVWGRWLHRHAGGLQFSWRFSQAGFFVTLCSS